MKTAEAALRKALEQRAKSGLLRELSQVPQNAADFSSNDYLSFSRSGVLVESLRQMELQFSGSGGSRLLAGNSALAEEVESIIAKHHHAEAALIFNSGYDANLGLLSAVAKRGDLILYDEYAHASIIDGLSLSHARSLKFQHNNLNQLEELLQKHKPEGSVFVVVESLYSMDGDFAPLEALAALSNKYAFNLIVDEAHATGVYGLNGSGLCDEEKVTDACFARVFTYGKAAGCHGAAVCGSDTLKKFLINYSRPLIFSTALPQHSLLTIKSAYKEFVSTEQRTKLYYVIKSFQNKFSAFPGYQKTSSPIQIIIIPGNELVSNIGRTLQEQHLDVRAVRSPTVPEGKERLRISLHAHNTEEEINNLFLALSSAARN